MINPFPVDFLNLHRNIQYYNTHRSECFLDFDLNLCQKSDMDTEWNSKKVSTLILSRNILKKIKELYTGSARDDKWLTLLKKDIQLLNIDKSNPSDAQKSEMELCHQEIINAIETLQLNYSKGLQPIDWLKKNVLNVVVLFDQDCQDDNGIVKDIALYSALRSSDNIIIVPKTIFNNSSLQRWFRYTAWQNIAFFEQKNSNFIIIVPFNLMQRQSPTWEPSLAALDLNPSQLNLINFQEIYNQTTVKTDVAQWTTLWKSHPTLKKRWHFVGHGESASNGIESTCIVGLNDLHFKILASVIKAQPTEFASFESCFIGRNLTEKPAVFKECSFPVIAWGRLDTSVIGRERDQTLYWLGVDDFLKNSSYSANFALKRLTHVYEKILPEFHDKSRYYQNQPLLLMPHVKESPMGFRSLQGFGKIQTVTYVNVKAAELNSKKPFRQSLSHCEPFINQATKGSSFLLKRPSNSNERPILELYPPLLPITIRLDDGEVEIHSLIPGNAHHHVDKLILSGGKPEEFFHSFSWGQKSCQSFKGLFINKLDTLTEKLHNVTLLYSPEGIVSCCYYNPFSKTYHLARTDLSVGNSELMKGKYNGEDINKTQFLLTTIECYIKTLPQSSSIDLSTGGQTAVDETLEAIKNGFEWDPADQDILNHFFLCLSKIAFDNTDIAQFPEFKLLPIEYQFILIHIVALKAKDLDQLLSFIEQGYINQNNWKAIIQKYKGERIGLYEKLVQKGNFEDYLGDLNNFDDSSILPIFEKWVHAYPERLNLYICKSLFNYGVKIRGFSLLKLLLSYPTMLESLDPEKVCIHYIENSSKKDIFEEMRTFMEKALEKTQAQKTLFEKFIPLILRTSPDLAMIWILNFNQVHKLFSEKECLDLIKQNDQEIMKNFYQPTKEQIVRLTNFLNLLREKTTSLSDDIAILMCAMEIDPTLQLCRNILSQTIVKANPTVLFHIIDKVNGDISMRLLKKTFKFSSEEIDFLNYLETSFNMNDKEKNEIYKKKFQHYAFQGELESLKSIGAWIQSLLEDEKKELCGTVIRCGLKNDEVMQEFISLGLLNLNDDSIVELVKDELSSSDANYQSLLKYFINALDSIDRWTWEIFYLHPRYFFNPQFIYILDYLSQKQKLIMPKLYCDVLLELTHEMMERNIFRNNKRRDKEFDEKIELLIRLAEWFAHRGVPMKKGVKDKTAKLIPRLIANLCSPQLILPLLSLQSQSEKKELFDDIFLISSMKGRWDILLFLEQQGCKYAPEIIQQAKFYATQIGITDLTLLDRLQKTS